MSAQNFAMNSLSPARVGARLLDQSFPDWAQRIDLKKFTIESSLNCILGQLYGNVENGSIALKFDLSRDVLLMHGFTASTMSGHAANIERLNEAWANEIAKRIIIRCHGHKIASCC